MKKIAMLLFLVCFECLCFAALPLHLEKIGPLHGNDFEILERYHIWLKRTKERLRKNSHVVQTKYGQIEYVVNNPDVLFESSYSSDSVNQNRPIILCLHGGFGGYDQGEVIGSHLVKQGFTVISPSRPGYLRTPLSVGKSNAHQADAMAALLDALHVDKVAVLGFSAGSPVAFEFATRHKERTWACVLESLGAQKSQSAEYELLTEILDTRIGRQSADFASWLFYLFATFETKEAILFLTRIDNKLSSGSLEERQKYVLRHPSQIEFAVRFMLTFMPISDRSEGIVNDISPKNLYPWLEYDYNVLKTSTMIIEARADDSGSYPETKKVVKRIKEANQIKDFEFVTVEDSGHFIWLGPDTNKWECRLKSFLQRNYRKNY